MLSTSGVVASIVAVLYALYKVIKHKRIHSTCDLDVESKSPTGVPNGSQLEIIATLEKDEPSGTTKSASEG